MTYKNKEDLKRWKKRDLTEKRQFINEYKTSRGCQLCGYDDHPQALTFDHLDQETKRRDWSSKNLTRWNRKELLEELAKCRVLCFNCHMVETYENEQHKFRRKSFSNGAEISFDGAS